MGFVSITLVVINREVGEFRRQTPVIFTSYSWSDKLLPESKEMSAQKAVYTVKDGICQQKLL
jgi:hypothetical protein